MNIRAAARQTHKPMNLDANRYYYLSLNFIIIVPTKSIILVLVAPFPGIPGYLLPWNVYSLLLFVPFQSSADEVRTSDDTLHQSSLCGKTFMEMT